VRDRHLRAIRVDGRDETASILAGRMDSTVGERARAEGGRTERKEVQVQVD
jgi:hypothetical protein